MESILFCLDGRQELTNEILKTPNIKTTIGEIKKYNFSDGEISLNYVTSIRGKRVYILTSPRNSNDIMCLLLAIDAAKRANAKEIIPILPYFPYSRQDKIDYLRGPIGAKVMAEMIEQRGATSVITFDLHADQIQGFFNIPITHLEGKNVFDIYISKRITPDTILCGPDAGSGKRVKRMQKQLQSHYGINLNYVMLDKTRKEANVIDDMVIIGDVTGKDVIILDDMVDTAGTLCKAADVLMEAGAKSVIALISHGVLSGPAFERIGNSQLRIVVISDSLEKHDFHSLCLKDYSEERCVSISHGNDKIWVMTVSDQIGIAMAAINNDMSYEALKASKS